MLTVEAAVTAENFGAMLLSSPKLVPLGWFFLVVKEMCCDLSVPMERPI